MSFHDDSHILSRLGILQSKDECPRKIHHSTSKAEAKKSSSEKERFVEVSIDGEVGSDSDSDEEPVFDRNSLLSPNRSVKVYRRKSESYKCIYLILLVTYFVIGAVWSVPLILQRASAKLHSNFLSINTLGLCLGAITGKLFCHRLSIAFVSFLCTTLLCGFSWTISDFTEVIDARISIFMLGFGSGNVLYGGFALWFIHWRGHNRKAVLFYVLMALGSSIDLAMNTQPILSPGSYNIVTSSVALHKRQAIEPTLEATSGNDTIVNNTTVATDSTSAKPKKPQVAQGTQVIETKSEQNEQMRKAALMNKTVVAPAAAMTGSEGLTTSTTKTYLSVTQRSLNDLHTSTSRSTPATTKAAVLELTTTPDSSSSQRSNIVPEMRLSIVEQSTHRRFASISSSVVLALYIVAFISCCIPCTTRGDTKFSKLFDPSVSGLTRGCRIRLTAVQLLASFIEGLVEMAAMLLSLNSNNSSILVLHHCVVTLFRIVVVTCGPCAYSLPGCCLTLLCSLLGCGFILVASVDPLFGLALMSASSGVFGLLVLLYIEVRVCPRAGTQLDYFIFPSVIGRFLSAFLCVTLKPSTSKQLTIIVLLSSVPLAMIFMLLVKSVSKAARLKEIMEYSSSPMLETTGEYVSLVERDVGSESGEEEDGSFANRDV